MPPARKPAAAGWKDPLSGGGRAYCSEGPRSNRGLWRVGCRGGSRGPGGFDSAGDTGGSFGGVDWMRRHCCWKLWAAIGVRTLRRGKTERNCVGLSIFRRWRTNVLVNHDIREFQYNGTAVDQEDGVDDVLWYFYCV